MNSPMRVIPFDGNATRWDAFVERSPHGTYCQLSGWRDVMSEVFGHETLYRVAVDDRGEWRAVLPLVRVRAPILGHYLVSMPFLNAGGPVGDPDGVSALCDWAVMEARRSGADLLEMRTARLVRSELRPAARKVAVRLPLGDDAEKLFGSFPSKLRSQVKRPMRDGMLASIGGAHRHAFYDVFSRTMRALGTPTLPEAFFAAVARRFPGRVEFGVVYTGNRAVAAGCGIVWRDEIELHWAGALREFGKSAPNMLLYWSFMHHAIARGVRTFNFGRCTAGSGTHAFKRQWGGTDTPLPWISWSQRDVTATPTPDKPVFRLAAACWRRLPLGVANAVGPRIARCLP